MEITLQTVRETLRNAFGRDSFVAAFIKTVSADETCATASINANGVMRYNPAFVGQYVTSPADLFTVVTHELMHPMFSHFVYQGGQLENLGADMVINAAISQVFAQRSGNGGLFKRFYKPIGLEGLLRPGSDMYQSRYARLYSSFYESTTSASLSTGEVIQTLKVLTPSVEIPTIMLMGSHGQGQTKRGTGPDGAAPAFPADALSRIAEDLRRIAERPGVYTAGYGEALYTFLLEVLKTHMSLKRALLERFTTRQKVDRFRRMLTQPRISVSPIPLQPSKRDFVLLAAGMPPLHFHNHAQRVTTETRGLAIYLDVSGSVNQHLPEIIGLLRSLRTELKTIFLFSNKVVEVPFQTLLAGHIETTCGTDFNCIAQHLLANRFDKAVILTDGYASMTEENQVELRKRKLCTLTILFGGKTDCDEFRPFGDVVQLEDVAD